MESARQGYGAAMSQQNVGRFHLPLHILILTRHRFQAAQYVAAVTNGGTDFKAIEAASDNQIDIFMSIMIMISFLVNFEYWYTDDPASCKPPRATGNSKPISSFCSISTPLGNQIPEYLEAGIFR